MAHARTNWTSARVEWRVTSPKAHLDVRRVRTRKPATPGRRVAESAVAVHDGWMMGEAPLRDFLHQTGHSARVVHGATALELATELRRDHFGAGGGGVLDAPSDAERRLAPRSHIKAVASRETMGHVVQPRAADGRAVHGAAVGGAVHGDDAHGTLGCLLYTSPSPRDRG